MVGFHAAFRQFVRKVETTRPDILGTDGIGFTKGRHGRDPSEGSDPGQLSFGCDSPGAVRLFAPTLGSRPMLGAAEGLSLPPPWPCRPRNSPL